MINWVQEIHFTLLEFALPNNWKQSTRWLCQASDFKKLVKLNLSCLNLLVGVKKIKIRRSFHKKLIWAFLGVPLKSITKKSITKAGLKTENICSLYSCGLCSLDICGLCFQQKDVIFSLFYVIFTDFFNSKNILWKTTETLNLKC